MTVGSLFSGIGGFDLGLERAGMQVKWQVEIDKYCLKVLEKHWPHVRRYTDIKTVDWHRVEPVDLVCGGFPCQPVSVAGKRKGTADARWLWPEFVRCLGVLRPRYVLIENVPGLLIRGFDSVLRDLALLRYDAEWDNFSACLFGAPHPRDRMFLVAYPSSIGRTVLRTRGNEPHNGKEQSLNRLSSKWCENRQLSAVGFADSFQRVWSTESMPVGVVDGLPDRSHRLKSIGNAIVPQIAEWLGRRILEHANL